MARYYYNGVLLPEIPAVEGYGYVAIRYDEANSRIDCVYSQTNFYYVDSAIRNKAGNSYKRYIASISNPVEWAESSDVSYSGWTIATNRRLLWSNHDIPNGSATSTTIYFYGNYPIPEAGECYYNGVVLPEIPADVLAEYPYVFIRQNNTTGHYDLIFSTVKTYKTSTNLTKFTNGVTQQLYKTPIVDAAMWVFAETTTNNWTIDSERTVLWSNYDIPNGSATSTAIYFYGSKPVPEGGQEPDAPSRTNGYLIRSDSTLYTITDGTITALAETEITASLFQTYGVDEIPDGSLLVGLTNPEVLYWQDSEDELPVLELTVMGTPPLPQVFTSEPMDLAHESIAGIDHAAVDAPEDVRFAISFDDGGTWKAFDGSAWFTVSDTAPGMVPSTMNAITAEQWAEVVVLNSYMVRFWLPNVTAYVKSVVFHYINP